MARTKGEEKTLGQTEAVAVTLGQAGAGEVTSGQAEAGEATLVKTEAAEGLTSGRTEGTLTRARNKEDLAPAKTKMT